MIRVLTVALALTAPALFGQPLPQKEALALFERVTQLMESTAVPVPGLARAAAPVLESGRQTLINLKATQPHTELTYDFLANVRAYLALFDSVAKPQPFPETARQQVAELRESVDRIEAHFRALMAQKERQLRSPDRDNLRRYAEANEKLGPPVEGRPRVVFLGDSITDGWRLHEYFPDRDFVNRGISGQITSEMLARMKADVIDLKPKAVLVLAGTNDIARGVPLNVIQDNLTMIADLAEHYDIHPIFASLLPISDYHKKDNPQYERSKQRPPQTIAAMNQWIRGFCAKREYPFVNYYAEMADASGFLKPDLADDGLHPNAKGYRIMAPLALAAVTKAAVPPPPEPKQQRKRRLGIF
jgi:lysophospholipase L1-like esterase